MTLFQLIFDLILIGVALYVLNRVIPMDTRVKTVLNAVIIIAVLLWVADLFGLGVTLGPNGCNHRIR